MNINVMINNQTYQVAIEHLDKRPIIAKIGVEEFEVWPEEETQSNRNEYDRNGANFTEKPNVNIQKRHNDVKAPIPGVIVAISVKVGDEVNVGQELCILEAMKMKNTIRANRKGNIGSVVAAVGQQVKHNDILFEYGEEGKGI